MRMLNFKVTSMNLFSKGGSPLKLHITVFPIVEVTDGTLETTYAIELL